MAALHVLPRAGRMAALCLTAALLQAAPARADVVFDFSGDCDRGCTGTATGVLTLADSYTFGADITDADFISFQYSSSQLKFDITRAGPTFGGGLNADGSLNAAGVLVISNGTFPFFETGGGSFLVPLTRSTSDAGSNVTFTLVRGTVPEPSTWAMMLLGFAGLGFAGYRKMKQAALASA
jgi:hypothetical protein